MRPGPAGALARSAARVPGLARAAACVLGLALLAACAPDPLPQPGSATPSTAETGAADSEPQQRFPDIIAATLIPQPDGAFDIAVTISSPYDTPQRYADGWRVLAADGTVLGTHTLLHDHSDEQPFTRTQPGLRIPPGTDSVVVEGRDLINGYGGESLVIDVPGI